MIFFVRFITATCLFAFLGKANVWLTPLSNVLLAIGYRFFLILSPLFSRMAGKYAVGMALIISSLGAILFCYEGSFKLAVGSVLTGIGLSVSGYLIKSQAAQTTKGAAHNKIAINVGSLLAGIILLFTVNNKAIFFGVGAFILLVSAIISFASTRNQKEIVLPIPKSFSIKRWVAWFLIGVAIGIKLFGVYSVLPQYLISHMGHLPYWYGIMVFLNSGVVILFQLPVIHFIDRFKKNNVSFKLTLLIMVSGMILIAFPQIFKVQLLLSAIIWTFLLSLVECSASYLDVLGSKAGFLLVKETSVGIGAGLTVLVSRYLPAYASSLLIGSIGLVAIMIASMLLYDDLKIIKQTNLAKAA